jgi:hypothetical protein
MCSVPNVEVEVFPIEPGRWIAVIEGPGGPFSTEAPSPEQVEPEVRLAIAEVLGRTKVGLSLLDDQGAPWSPEIATKQAERLNVR